MMITNALDMYARSIARIFEDRANTVGSSDVGKCARQVFFLKNEGDADYGTPRNPDFVDRWGATQRGSIYETHVWEPALRARYGERLLFAGNQQQTFALDFLSGTPDGLLIDLDPGVLALLGVPDIGGDGSLLVECKTVDPRVKLDGPKPEHVYQVQVGLGLIHTLTPHRPEWALISCSDASFWDLVLEFPVRRDPKIFEAARQRATKIMTATAAEQLAPEGYIAGAGECDYCPFSRACGILRHAVPTGPQPEPLDQQFVSEIADLAREIKDRRATVETAATVARALENQLKERLRSKGVRRVVGDGIAVTWSSVRGRPAFNDKAIREAAAEAGVDLAQYEVVGEPTDRLTIRVAEQSRSAA
jgi:hypothetical protein